MRTMHVPSRTLSPTLKVCKWGYLVFERKRLQPRVLSRQQHNRCDFFVIYISATKFEEHCSNISRDILYSLFNCYGCPTCDIITFLICIIKNRNVSKNERFPKGDFEKPFMWAATIFHFRCTFSCAYNCDDQWCFHIFLCSSNIY